MMAHEPSAPFVFTPEYYERLRDLESSSWWNAGMRDVATSLLGLAALPSRGRLLDVGCGTGQTMGWFKSIHPGWETFGLDVAIEGLTAARASGLSGVTRASALELPFGTASMDLAISLDVLQHLPLGGGDAQVLREIARVVRPGGHLLLRTNAQSVPSVADDTTFMFHKYEPAELRAKLNAAGFQILRLGRLNALLGLAEIPRELRARTKDRTYQGLLSEPRPRREASFALKRAWLRLEGRLVRSGVSLPLGRTILALCRR